MLKRIAVLVIIALAGATAQAAPINWAAAWVGIPTDDEHMAMYTECMSKEHVNVLLVASFVSDIVTDGMGSFVTDLATTYAEGYKKRGCDVFLTEAQLRTREAAELRNRKDNQCNPFCKSGGASH
jgi:hypothetical protein